jgi:hypothetical protein
MLRRFSADTQEATEKSSEKYMHFPRGLIRGALNSLGMECEVRAEVRPMPPPNPKVPITDPKDNYGLACMFYHILALPTLCRREITFLTSF